MLSRANSDTRLKRAKSTPLARRGRTIPFDSTVIDPETVHQHAITAAHVAMARATGRQQKDLSRCNSNTNKENLRSTRSAPHCASESGLRRNKSLMYAKSNGDPTTLATPTRHGDDPSDSLLEPLDDELDFCHGYGSAPSSYKRLRKARSALSPQSHGSRLAFQSPRSIGSRMTLRSEHRHLFESGYGFKVGLKRSFSLLKNRKRSFTTARRRSQTQRTNTDEAVQMAREQFLQDAEQQRLIPKPSSLSLSVKSKRQPKVFRRTARSSRTTNFGDAVASDNQQLHITRPTSGRVRDFSRGLRDKMNRFFGRTSSNTEELPVQHVDASRAYFGDNGDPENLKDLDLTGSEQKDPYHRESIYIPSSQTHVVDSDLIPRSSSLRSNRSTESLTDYSKSRVTSWADSTVANSLANCMPVERKRLSIIQEIGGPHQPSSSAGMHAHGIPAFQSPLCPTNSSRTFRRPVDSERVYSALLKKLDEVEQVKDPQDSNEAAPNVPDRRYHGTGYLDSSALAHVRASRTIRTVPSSGSFHSSSAEISFPGQKLNGSQQSLLKDNDPVTPTPTFSLTDTKPQQYPGALPRDGTTAFFTPSNSRNELNLPAIPQRSSKNPAADDVDDADSIIISHQNANISATSISAYSRTTSGNTPAPKSGTDIFASRRHGITDDLRNYWLDRQRGPNNILAAAPATRSPNNNNNHHHHHHHHHYRERTQIVDDDTAIGAGAGVRSSSNNKGQQQALRYILSPPSSPSKTPRPSPPTRHPLLELKQPTPRRHSPVEEFVGARSGWDGHEYGTRKDSGLSMKMNDENAKIVLPKRSRDGTGGGKTWIKRKGSIKRREQNEHKGDMLEPAANDANADGGREVTALPVLAVPKQRGVAQRKTSAPVLAPMSGGISSGLLSKYERDEERDVNNNSSPQEDSDKENVQPHDNNIRQHERPRWLGGNGSLTNSNSNGNANAKGNASNYAKGPVLARNRRLVSDFLRSRRRRGVAFGSRDTETSGESAGSTAERDNRRQDQGEDEDEVDNEGGRGHRDGDGDGETKAVFI